MSTVSVSAKQIKRSWQVIDAKDQILGRLATGIAKIIMGKNKPEYVPYLDMGDNVIVINAAQVKVSGKKEEDKMYVRHSGYPGGYREENLATLRERKPEELIRHAVWGMIPKGKLGRAMIKKLYVFSGTEHPFKDKLRKGKDE